MDRYCSPRLKDDQNFLELSYSELEERNLKTKKDCLGGKSQDYFQKKFTEELKKEKGIKAVTVCFSDLEGKFHMLDYNKTYLLESYENLTFDGSSVHGFSSQNKSDLRLVLDWSTFRWLPADIFGHGKVLLFANVQDQEGTPYIGDYRSNIAILTAELKKKSIRVNVAPEIEGLLVEGENAEQSFDEKSGFTLSSKGGYFNSLPQDTLRRFIDLLAEATRALAFENEKDHPEVAPSQFEMNYKYTDILYAADQVQIYKLIARQIAKNLGLTATFLPKPIMKINGTGMHTNISISKNGKNIFFDAKGKYGASKDAHNFITGILNHASDICLALNSSVNSYRRLDPTFEAPNEIKVSSTDRGAMIRVPIGNKNSARVEVRSVAADTNPYMTFFLILQAGLRCMNANKKEISKYNEIYKRPAKKLPKDIYHAISAFKNSDFIKDVMKEENVKKYIDLKEATANRCPRDLGTRMKAGEVWYHHEISNQILWNKF